MCQSVFFDKSSRLCYWNNNIPVTITTATTCGSLLYLQLHTETRPTSFCCSSFDPTATPEPSTSAKSTTPPTTTITTTPTTTTTTPTTTTTTTPTTTTTTPTTTVDPDGFLDLPSSGIKVRLIPAAQIQSVAVTDCFVFSGSKLAVINSAAKQLDVQNYLQGLGVNKAYIGATRTPLGWRWSDGSTVGYTNWASSSGFLKDCSIMDSSKSYKWQAVYCTDSHPYLCQKLFT
ncbi:hypothetical protein SNE40_000270 [Patella caerulea]|uniref:C-type lectin domain-containing protein n=1 Tax=Patella caerulea TaxID=87958 RepID=A0AAN8Q9T2_PATCE